MFLLSLSLHKNNGKIGGTFLPESCDGTHLQDLSLMNHKGFSLTHCETHLNMKLNHAKMLNAPVTILPKIQILSKPTVALHFHTFPVLFLKYRAQ